MTWIKKYIDPLNISPWKILLIDSLEKWDGDKILLLGKEGLNTVASTLNPFWKDIHNNSSNLQNEKVTDGNDVLSQSIWLNRHIKDNNTSPCLKNWIENDIYIINDLFDQNCSGHISCCHHIRRVVWYYTCNTKTLEALDHNLLYKENRFIHQLQIDPTTL